MKSRVVTFITLNMTLEEARRAVVDMTDAQLAIRAALYEVEPGSIAEIIERSAPRLLGAPGNGRKRQDAGGKKDRLKPRVRASGKMVKVRECPHCHESRKAQGYSKHVAACAVKHGVDPAAVLEVA